MADKIINDSFGGYIGMSRREIWHLRNGGLTRDQLRQLSEKDKEYLLSVADRNTLWQKPKFEYADEKEGMIGVIRDLAEYVVRSGLPVKYSTSKMKEFSPEDFADMLLFFRDRTKEIAAKKLEGNDVDVLSYAQCLGASCYQSLLDLLFESGQKDEPLYDTYAFQYSILSNLRMSVSQYPRLVKNAFVAKFWEWPNPFVLDNDYELDYLDKKNRTGVSVKKRGIVTSFHAHKDYETLEEFRSDIEGKDEKEKERRKESAKNRRGKNSVPERPRIEELVRINAPEHKIELEPDAFIRQFNFWGGEFGSWVTQNERKQNLVLAGNALADLAWVLNIEETEIGAGNLSFAFGARGKGGKRAAAAHYEPILNVINLTREFGAGCVAHEWGHYVDFKVLAPLKKGSDTMKWLMRRPPKNSMEKLEEFRKRINEQKAESKLATWCPTEKEFYEKIDSFDSVDKYVDFVKSVINTYIKPKSFKNAETWGKWLHWRSQVVNLESVPTNFMRNALAFDEGRSKPYWSTPTELFARAVEKYVFDLLAEHGIKNNYLVEFYQHPTLSPYPSDEEMKLFAPHIKALFSENFKQRQSLEIKSKEKISNSFPDISSSQPHEQLLLM